MGVHVTSRVIVVDDDPSILELLKALLEAEGYQVMAFDSAPAALQAALTQHPNAAVIDLMMPGMNGKDLVQALKVDSTTRDIPVLICSAYYGDLRRCASEFGQEDIFYLRKPFRIEELLEIISRMASQRGLGPVDAQAPSEPALPSGGAAK